ncbi:MAG: anti-sigma factor family protein [Solirubrobacterales bacterium]
MDCKQCRKHAEDYVDNSLDQIRRAELEEHLAACATCKRYVSYIEREIDVLSDYDDVPEPSQALTRQILDAVRREETSDATAFVKPPRRYGSLFVISGVISAAFLVFVVGLIFTPLFHSSNQLAKQEDSGLKGGSVKVAQKMAAPAALNRSSKMAESEHHDTNTEPPAVEKSQPERFANAGAGPAFMPRYIPAGYQLQPLPAASGSDQEMRLAFVNGAGQRFTIAVVPQTTASAKSSVDEVRMFAAAPAPESSAPAAALTVADAPQAKTREDVGAAAKNASAENSSNRTITIGSQVYLVTATGNLPAAELEKITSSL